MSACFPAFRRKRTLLAESVVWDADYFFCLLVTLILLSFFFFFQAEDGIRDSSVTGVQTCALPILVLFQDQDRCVALHRPYLLLLGHRQMRRVYSQQLALLLLNQDLAQPLAQDRKSVV